MKTKRAILFILAISLFVTSLKAQEVEKSRRIIGLSATFQAMQYGINIPIWLDEKVTFAPALELIYAEDLGSDLGFGFVSKFYLNNKKLSPYIGVKLGLINYKNIEFKTADYYGGLAFGGEYFLDRQFSISVEIQGNFTKSHDESFRFGNPGNININTASMVSANVYF
ncbi:MAG: hypothetical protein HN704_09595 [Bacteroidetes bacterium]|jgi:hypothetical protein|nr:hypothetical protein [Bacteroidota bacterium]MBT7142690.1 hypothetical protein [Bacteroidota bacterium]MBT7491848.1 hypothetical protein [Bacteroidota bacterium]